MYTKPAHDQTREVAERHETNSARLVFSEGVKGQALKLVRSDRGVPKEGEFKFPEDHQCRGRIKQTCSMLRFQKVQHSKDRRIAIRGRKATAKFNEKKNNGSKHGE